MKLLVPLLLLTLLLSCTSQEKDRDKQFYANVAQSVITPDVGTFMVEPDGKLSTGTHDELYVKAIALGDGKNIFVIVSFDLIGLDDSLVERIRKAVFDSAGIKAEQLMLSCTHTHNSPITFDAMFPPDDLMESMGVNNARDEQWIKRMIAITAGTVKSAVKNLKEVSVNQGKAPVQIGFNRRLIKSVDVSMTPNPNGPALKETDVVMIKDDQSEIAVLFSYAAHPVCVHETSTEFTADFPGYAVQYIKSQYPASIPVFLQGCGGNINSTLKGGYEAAELDGNKLGEAVLNGVETSEIIDPSSIIYGQRDFYLPFMYFDKKTAESLIKRIGESYKTINDNPELKANPWHRELTKTANRLKYLAENKDSIPGLPFQAQAVALGRSLAIIAFPDEVFVNYALYIKEHSPFEQTIVLGFTNGTKSYIPSSEAFFLGGYEPRTAQIRYGWPHLSPECDKIIKAESMSLLTELWEKYSKR